MANALLKIDHKIVHKCSNAVLTPIHTVAVAPVHTVAIRENRTVLQGCTNAVHNYVRTYVRTRKYQNSNVVHMTGALHGSLSIRKTARRVAVTQTH